MSNKAYHLVLLYPLIEKLFIANSKKLTNERKLNAHENSNYKNSETIM